MHYQQSVTIPPCTQVVSDGGLYQASTNPFRNDHQHRLLHSCMCRKVHALSTEIMFQCQEPWCHAATGEIWLLAWHWRTSLAKPETSNWLWGIQDCYKPATAK